MSDVLDTLDLGSDSRLSIITENGKLAAVPMVSDGHRWRRAAVGDGAAEALLDVIAAQPGSRTVGNFTIQAWATRAAAGEQPMGVDQTNESVIVGGTAVVKWATHLQDGPHPAPARITALRNAGFTGMPTPWGLITWHPPDAPETLAAYVDEYLPGAVDGWTWAVDLVTASALGGGLAAATAAGEVGALIAELHAALSGTASVASAADAGRWRDDALGLLETVCTIGDSVSAGILRDRRDEVAGALEVLGDLAGTPLIDGHGDLHVGQVLRSADRFVVTDFDGNPVLPAARRILPIPAVLDVAGMIQSLAHVSIVARKYSVLDAEALAAVDTSTRDSLLAEYRRRLGELGHADLFDPRPLRALRMQQVMREIVYAETHLPRWMYVPDAALPALLDDRTET